MAASLHTDARENVGIFTKPRPRPRPHPRPRPRPCPSPSFSEFPDSPSVYSHALHSPDADLDDTTASTLRSLSTDHVQDASDLDDHTDDASHRISLQGPKIRFHSRAPWEVDDDIPHGEESDNSSRSGTIGSRLKGKASRADSLIRTFGRGSSVASRPSVDSARSQVSAGSSSFEITPGNYPASRGALYAVAKESMSTSSLSSTTAPASAHHQNFFSRATNHPNPGHHFTQTHAPLSRATANSGGTARASITQYNAPMLPPSSDASRIGHERKPTPPLLQRRTSHEEFVHHPYANPDLVVPYAPPSTIPSHRSIFGDMTGSDSNSTVIDSISARSAPFSVMSTETSVTSLTSRELPHGNLRVNGKEISSPISVLRPGDISYVDRNARFLSLHPPPAGFDGPRWKSPSLLPTVTLISLQEAQARERSRSNTVHTTIARPQLPFPNSGDTPEITEDQPKEINTGGILARSTSVGARYKIVPHPTSAEMRDSESAVSSSTSTLPGRALKHKKSGFMRLFGGRNSEGDRERERSGPPPILPFADAYAEQNSQIHGTGKPSKLTLPRGPVPSSSPILHGTGVSNATSTSTNGTSSGGNEPDGKVPSSRRRQPPSLSVVTSPPDHCAPASVAGPCSPSSSNLTAPLSVTTPQSAPPGKTNFPGLKLRPVSTSFSSHFADIVAGTVEEWAVRTPSSAASSSTALSPVTPISMRRNDDAPATTVETLGEQSLTIQGLQDQLVLAKKAWQQHIWELRGQIRDLTAELKDLRAADDKEYCEACGRGDPQGRHASLTDEKQPKKVGIVNRPRARVGDTARFASGN